MSNIIHYGVKDGSGHLYYEETLCGCKGEKPCNNTTDIWEQVTCKRCLKNKKEIFMMKKLLNFENDKVKATFNTETNEFTFALKRKTIPGKFRSFTLCHKEEEYFSFTESITWHDKTYSRILIKGDLENKIL